MQWMNNPGQKKISVSKSYLEVFKSESTVFMNQNRNFFEGQEILLNQ